MRIERRDDGFVIRRVQNLSLGVIVKEAQRGQRSVLQGFGLNSKQRRVHSCHQTEILSTLMLKPCTVTPLSVQRRDDRFVVQQIQNLGLVVMVWEVSGVWGLCFRAQDPGVQAMDS